MIASRKLSEETCTSPSDLRLGIPSDGLMRLGHQRAGEEDGRVPWHQLLIVGNGFDLACGLRSKYSDFHEARKAFFAREENAYHARPDQPEHERNVWDIALDVKGDAGWADIEHSIASWVASRSLATVTEMLNNLDRFGETGSKELKKGEQALANNIHGC